MRDLAIVITSLNDASWLPRCLGTLFAHAEGVDLDVVVVDIESDDETGPLLRREFPQVRIVQCRNLGFAHANNRGYLATNSRYVLFLNPDTEWVEGDLASAVRAMDERPTVGIAGCRQFAGDGSLYPTMRRFMTPMRALAQALGSERVAPWAGQRVLDMSLYDRERTAEWVVGSWMLARREALLSAGCLDERYFLYSEEEDLCRRVRRAGWEISYLPQFTIIHHFGKAGVNPRLEAQRAYAKLQYSVQYERPAMVALMRAAMCAGYAVRIIRHIVRREWPRVRAQVRGLRVAAGLDGAPFENPPATGLSDGAVRDVERQLAPACNGRDPSASSVR
jgi:N-acetylglucosaminyl-diphospho-decaprenol L-rhamnosyltransferase